MGNIYEMLTFLTVPINSLPIFGNSIARFEFIYIYIYDWTVITFNFIIIVQLFIWSFVSDILKMSFDAFNSFCKEGCCDFGPDKHV